MRILVVTEVLPPEFAWQPEVPVRGTERFYVETSNALQESGHEVTVAFDGTVRRVDGVLYAPRSEVARAGWDSVLLCNPRSDEGFRGERIVFWTAFADFRLKHLRGVDAAVVISQYAAELAGEGTMDSPELYVVPLGINKQFWTPSEAAREDTCIYTSSPDRGGSWLRSVWTDIRRETGFELVQSPYPPADSWSDARLRSELRKAKYWLHPGRGRELFCLAGAEAQACGAVPIIVPNEALAETVRWGHRFPADKYLEGIVSVLKGSYVSGADAGHLLSWAQATAELEKVLTP